ncbi:hypothetical protein GCM10027592_45620 [Spirosoma flavus]
MNLIKTYTCLVCLLILSLSNSHTWAQDVIYFSSDGTSVADARLVDLIGDKIVFTVGVDGDAKTHKFGRSSILMAFTKAGNYLLMSELATDLEQAKQQLRTFLEAPPRNDGKDFLIKAVPLTVIPAEITYESDDAVNYKAASGNSASINKVELMAILYRDGRHSIIAPAGDVAPILAESRPSIYGSSKPATSVPSSKTATNGQAETTPIKTSATEPVAVQTTSPTTEPSTAQPVTAPNVTLTRPRKVLSEEEKEIYRQKSMSRVDEFVAYINIITDKSVSDDAKERAIAQAEKLFIKGSTIEVTSTRRPGSNKLSIKNYLNRLKLLPYKTTQIEWADTKFINDLTQETDGNYYGTIAGEQTFVGKDANGKPMYIDKVSKNVRVKLESYQKVIDGQEIDKWRVLLGNVSVEAEQN